MSWRAKKVLMYQKFPAQISLARLLPGHPSLLAGVACDKLQKVVTVTGSCQQWRGTVQGFGFGVSPQTVSKPSRRRRRLASNPQEEVSMTPSCPIQGLLIAENAG